MAFVALSSTSSPSSRHDRFVKTDRRKVVTMMQGKITEQIESGQTMAEYAVVLGVITLAIVTTFAALSGAINDAFERTLEVVSGVF
jgi:Flp pilus assembly pilin Flp